MKNLILKWRWALAVLSIGLLMGTTKNLKAQGYYGGFYTHIATASTLIGDFTILNDTRLNSTPGAIILITDNWDPNYVYNNFNSGIWYYDMSGYNNWAVYNEDGGTAIPVGSAYNILLPSSNGSAFIHTASASNIIGNWTTIDNPATNNNPNALVFITHNWGASGDANNVYNNKPTGVWYDGTKWAIYNEDGSAFPDGAAYNVFVPDPGTHAFVHTATASNITDWVTYIDNPLLNGNPDATIIVTHNWNPGGVGSVYNDKPIGVYYTGAQWAIYNQDAYTPMPVGASFNVLIADNFTAVNDISAAKPLSFSPNPATDKIAFSNTSDKTLRIQVLDISGKLLIDKLLLNESLDVSALIPGIYIMKVDNTCYKLIKQ
jgi:hypothetical protein